MITKDILKNYDTQNLKGICERVIAGTAGHYDHMLFEAMQSNHKLIGSSADVARRVLDAIAPKLPADINAREAQARAQMRRNQQQRFRDGFKGRAGKANLGDE